MLRLFALAALSTAHALAPRASPGPVAAQASSSRYAVSPPHADGQPLALTAWSARSPLTSRRSALFSAGAGLLAATLQPQGAHASYAMYAASQDTFIERKASGYVPVATSDKASLAEIQADITRKRPQSELKRRKPPQYCAGQTASVSPMLENVRAARPPGHLRFCCACPPCSGHVRQVCANVGISKADQSNTRVDAFGNMNIGQYGTDLLDEEAKKQAAKAAARSR
jgi:hypothetical protein